LGIKGIRAVRCLTLQIGQENVDPVDVERDIASERRVNCGGVHPCGKGIVGGEMLKHLVARLSGAVQERYRSHKTKVNSAEFAR